MHHVPHAAGSRHRLEFSLKPADPATLSQWYATHLGIDPPPQSYEEPVWFQAGGPTVFAPFASEDGDNPYLGPTGWGINFRVSTSM